ncbi:MAG: hypothetical protein ACD_72C00289G0007 [uncultured bacterium]|nr:MAG: hypothetical protein ACD_72C00289G0007 [uncultured bacterium]
MHGDLDQALVFDLLKSLSELIKTYYYKTLKDPEMVNKVFANIFSVFLRRLEYFKKCNQLSRDARKLPYEISADIMNLRNWQKDHIQEVVKPRLPKILEDFPPPLISALNSSVGSVELNLGCTVECDFCAFEPDKTVSSRLPFDEAAWFAINLSNSQASFYKATDPLDYTDPNDSSKDYVELMLVRQAATKSLSYTSTAYPKHSADRLKQMGDGVMRVSVSKMNKKRLVKDGFFEEVGPDIFVPVDPDLADALYFGGTYSFSRFNVRIEEGDGWSGQDLARQVLARNLFSGIGVNKLDENTIVESGRQRDVVAKKTGKPNESISTTISCLDSVVVSPGKIQNIVPMYSTAEYRKGEIGVDIKPENLLDGDRKMLEIFKNFSTGKPTNIKELLPYCLINFSFSSMAQYPAHPMYIEQGHTITFRTFDKNGNFPKTWKCIYNQLNGQVINLVMSFPSNTSEK